MLKITDDKHKESFEDFLLRELNRSNGLTYSLFLNS